MCTTEEQAIQQIVNILQQHGQDPIAHDVLYIADEYRQETGGYENIPDHAGMILALANLD